MQALLWEWRGWLMGLTLLAEALVCLRTGAVVRAGAGV